MRITVIGATSRIGHHLLAEGRRRDHAMVACTRRPGTLADPGALAAVVEGDGRDRSVVRSAVDGADAVIVIVNGGNRRDPHQAAEVVRTATAAMTDLGVRRLVATSAYPVVADKPRLPMWVLHRLLATTYADCAEMERVIAASGLDWTIVRPNRLTDKPATGAVTTAPGLLANPRPITRADVAATLLDTAEDPALSGTALNITNS